MNLNIVFAVLIFSLIVTFSSNYSYASSESILITSSTKMNDVVFDGTWTFPEEWKFTSFDQFNFKDNNVVVLRSAHQDDFIYLYIEAVNDTTLDKGIDKATICIDGKNNKNKISDYDDYCFSATLGKKQGIIFQGGSINAITGNFQKIVNPENFIAISNISNEKNRYSVIPHPTYEFKIPIEIIQRSDNYGFFISVYDGNSNTFYTWPNESSRETFFKIPSPSTWGNIISPDKSIPELSMPLTILLFSILTIIIIQFKTQIIFRYY